MTATNICYNFVGFRYSPPFLISLSSTNTNLFFCFFWGGGGGGYICHRLLTFNKSLLNKYQLVFFGGGGGRGYLS